MRCNRRRKCSVLKQVEALLLQLQLFLRSDRFNSSTPSILATACISERCASTNRMRASPGIGALLGHNGGRGELELARCVPRDPGLTDTTRGARASDRRSSADHRRQSSEQWNAVFQFLRIQLELYFE